MKKLKMISVVLIALFAMQGCSTDSSSTDETTKPVLTTATSFSDQSTANPKSGGNITSDGGSPVTARGIVWGTAQNPTIADLKTNDGDGTGEFVSTMTGLSANTKYYVRAYATNSIGTAYGEQKTITTANFSTALMTAKIAGTPYNYLFPNLSASSGKDVTVFKYGYADDPRFLAIHGGINFDLPSAHREISLYIPDDKWAPGTYSLSEIESLETVDKCQAHLSLPNVGQIITSGTITITEFNLTTKRIKGTFAFSYHPTNSGTTYQVTNGTFDYALNADYFN